MTALLVAVILGFGAAMLGIGMAAIALVLSGRTSRTEPARTEYVERYERRVTTPNAIAIRDGGVSTQQFEPWESERQQPQPLIIMLPNTAQQSQQSLPAYYGIERRR